jgi:group I intron endonuclease
MLVYLILNHANNKVYIGKHRGNDAQTRWKRHIRDAKAGSIYPLHCAIRKHGSESFAIVLLSSFASSEEDLNQQEIFFIAKYRATEAAYGYNLSKGGEGSRPTSSLRALRKEFMKGNKNALGRRWKHPTNSERIKDSRWVTNGSTNKYIRNAELKAHLINGWRLGRINTKWIRNSSTHFWINNGTIRKRVKFEDLQRFLTDGWSRGKGKIYPRNTNQA